MNNDWNQWQESNGTQASVSRLVTWRQCARTDRVVLLLCLGENGAEAQL